MIAHIRIALSDKNQKNIIVCRLRHPAVSTLIAYSLRLNKSNGYLPRKNMPSDCASRFSFNGFVSVHRKKIPDASKTVGCNVCKFMENKPRPENVKRYKVLILKKRFKALFTLRGKLIGKNDPVDFN